MKSTNRQTALVALALAAVVFVSCTHAGGWGSGSAWMRNESTETVEVSIAFPSQSFLGSADARVFDVPPWREGWCHSLGQGINRGEATISVSGPSVSFPITTTITLASPPDDNLSILIDAVGEVHFSIAEPPPEDGPCSGYGQELPTASP